MAEASCAFNIAIKSPGSGAGAEAGGTVRIGGAVGIRGGTVATRAACW